MVSSWNTGPEIPGEAQVFEFSLILLRTVNEFTKTPGFWRFSGMPKTVGYLTENFIDLDAGSGRSGKEGLAYQFVEPFRMLLLGHHPAIIKDFERCARVQLK